MAKAAVLESSSSVIIQPIARVQSGLKMKRKTPSELRDEQLKRSGGTLLDYKLGLEIRCESGVTNGMKKNESAKMPRYINTCVDDIYPVRKSTDRCKVLFGKDMAKPCFVKKQDTIVNEMPRSPGCAFVAQNFPVDLETVLSRCKADVPKSEHSESSTMGTEVQGFRRIEKCSQNALRNVVEIHFGNEKPSGFAKVDMENALKVLVARDKSAMHSSSVDSFVKDNDHPASTKFFPEFQVPGNKVPLDFTLKSAFRLISSSSVKWCQRLNATPAFFDIDQCTSKHILNLDQQSSCINTDVMYSKALKSWVFPQSSFPTSIITAVTLSATKGEKDFLLKRQHDWEDSFRDLYYMFRKSICNMLYVYASQFVILFIRNKSLQKRQSCNAFLSRSTHGLRSLLRKHEVSFSMPLCHVEVEQATEAELVELSEIEKRNLGQVFHQDSISVVDNTPQSLLMFSANQSVHGLYDFLLNYRSLLNSLSGADVPSLYAPVPFLNASLCTPVLKCKEMKRADAVIPSSSGSDTDDINAAFSLSNSPICYSLEIKETILPPWVICRLCAAMSQDGRTFESFFTTEPSSIGLNIALESFCKKTDLLGNPEKLQPPLESGDVLGLPEAALSPCLRSASLRRLMFCKGSYTAYVNQM